MNNLCCSSVQRLDSGTFERPRYYARQVMTPVEMDLEHEYWRAKFRHHNLMLHGWGVVCGALVCSVKKGDGSGWEEWEVQVQPGYILAPCGDEIMIGCACTVDLRSDGVTGLCGDPTGQPADPWCQEVFVGDQQTPLTLYVAIRYKEVMARPVRVQPTGCGCEDNACEFSRWRDGYEIKALKSAPAPQPPPLKEIKLEADKMTIGLSPVTDCPVCDDSWVVLATVQVKTDGTIESIDNCALRRNVASLAASYWTCASKLPAINEQKIELVLGQTVPVTLSGTNFNPQATVDLGPGVEVTKKTVKANKVIFYATAHPNATLGQRTLRIINPDWGFADLPITIQVPSK